MNWIKEKWQTNKKLVIGIGAGVVALIGGIIWYVTKGKKGKSGKRF